MKPAPNELAETIPALLVVGEVDAGLGLPVLTPVVAFPLPLWLPPDVPVLDGTLAVPVAVAVSRESCELGRPAPSPGLPPPTVGAMLLVPGAADWVETRAALDVGAALEAGADDDDAADDGGEAEEDPVSTPLQDRS